MAANSDIKGVKDYNIDLNNTYMTTIHTIEFLQKYFKKNTKIIFASSSAIYGNVKSRISEN